MNLRIEQRGDDVLIYTKAVPNASRDQIIGLVGDRLKVRISAPPEAGKANKAICGLIARALGVKRNRVLIESGASSAEKVVRIAGARTEAVISQLFRG